MTPHAIEPLQIPGKEFEFHGATDDVTVEFFNQHDQQLTDVRLGPVGTE